MFMLLMLHVMNIWCICSLCCDSRIPMYILCIFWCIYIAIRSNFFSCKCYGWRNGSITIGGYAGASGKYNYPWQIGEAQVVKAIPGEIAESVDGNQGLPPVVTKPPAVG
jgi:hypothetical protein